MSDYFLSNRAFINSASLSAATSRTKPLVATRNKLVTSIKIVQMNKSILTLSKPLSIKNIAYFFVLFFILPTIQAQDVAIVGWDASGSSSSGDEVSFILLRNFTAGEVIYITEDEYVEATNVFNSTEGHLAFTVPAGGLLENEVVSIVESSSGVYTEQCGTGGTVTGTGSWSLATDAIGGMADEIYAYSASNPAAPWSSVTEIHSFAWSATSAFQAVQDPSPDYPNVIIIAWNVGGPWGYNADFMDANRVNTTLADLQNGANWNKGSNNNPPANISLSCTNFINHMLPVELINFDAKEKNETTFLNWSTAIENNNSGFEVEHSIDGKLWEKINFIRGNGNSTIVNNYDFVHRDPKYGINYYRLKQIDFDGRFEYSKVISVNFKGENGVIGELYPNPSKSGMINLEYSSQNNEEVNISVFDAKGELVINQIRQILNGNNNLSFDFSNFDTGIYIVKIGREKNLTYRKLIIER